MMVIVPMLFLLARTGFSISAKKREKKLEHLMDRMAILAKENAGVAQSELESFPPLQAGPAPLLDLDDPVAPGNEDAVSRQQRRDISGRMD